MVLLETVSTAPVAAASSASASAPPSLQEGARRVACRHTQSIPAATSTAYSGAMKRKTLMYGICRCRSKRAPLAITTGKNRLTFIREPNCLCFQTETPRQPSKSQARGRARPSSSAPSIFPGSSGNLARKDAQSSGVTQGFRSSAS